MTDYQLSSTEDQHELLPEGEVLFCEGDPGDRLYIILDGDVDISVEDKLVDRLHGGTIIGEMALVDDHPRSATATAATDVTLLPVDRERFSELVRESPDFALHVMSIMSKRLRRMLFEELEKQKMEEELDIGRRIQLSLLPECCPDIPGWEFAAAYRSARQVGGDFYDFIFPPEEPNQVHIVTADVTGKGVPAALFMASCRTAIRAEALKGVDPSEALTRTNRLVALDTRSQLFLSAFYAVLDTESGRLRFSNGGLEWPILIRKDSNNIEKLTARGLVLGAFEDAVYEEKRVDLNPGDTVVFYTDGVTDARNPEGDFFGGESLIPVIESGDWSDSHELVDSIMDAIETFREDTPPFDDITLVILRRLSD
jgi:serine phosphatase RsbU (regulator of sigma subunit)